MDGVHDMGGMDGFGKIAPEPDEPPFHAVWEGRVLAMQRAMAYAGAWQIDVSRSAQERLPPQVYLTASYYQRWELAMESNVTERGFAGADEIAAGHALRAGKPLKRKLTADLVQQGMTRGSFFRQAQAPARFKPGDRVRTRNIHPPTHTRLPRYARSCRAPARLSRLSRLRRNRQGGQPAVALHSGIRRSRALGRGCRPDHQGIDRRLRTLSRTGLKP
jgi:nitrile hydratase beta subunit